MTAALDRGQAEQFRTVVTQRLGLHYEDEKLDVLAEIARQRMASLGAPFGAWLAQLSSSPDELRALAEQLTVNETFFFRNADSFQALAEVVLPERIRVKTPERSLRILSAGCASGEEPYSLALLVREALPDLASWDVKIIGIDVNAAVLAKAKEARYSEWSLRATSAQTRRSAFRPEGRDFVLAPEIQRMVTFEERNLVEADPAFWQSLACDVVFCRNVLMYFTRETARGVVGRITRALLPGGFLFLGHAETLRGLSHDFHLCHTHNTFYYRRCDGPDRMAAGTGAPCARPAERVAAPPVVVETVASWVDVIERSSARIALLARERAWPPGNGPLVQAVASECARAWDLGLALEAVRQERFADALELISSLPEDSREDPEVLLLRGVLLTNTGRLAESEEVCRRLLGLDELNASAHYLMALCREHAGDASAALEHGQAAIHLDARFAMPHLHLGITARRAGDLATAQRELGEALVLLAGEEASKLLLFGGGFSRETLLQLCRTELLAAGGEG